MSDQHDSLPRLFANRRTSRRRAFDVLRTGVFSADILLADVLLADVLPADVLPTDAHTRKAVDSVKKREQSEY